MYLVSPDFNWGKSIVIFTLPKPQRGPLSRDDSRLAPCHCATMQLGCNNGSFALPPKREFHEVKTVEAAAAPNPSRFTDGIVVTKAQDRLLELIEREQLPGDVCTRWPGRFPATFGASSCFFRPWLTPGCGSRRRWPK